MSSKSLNFKDIVVIKRNGARETFNVDKIHKIIEKACDGITGVSVSDVVMAAHLTFYDGMTTKEIHRALTKAAADLISEATPNYQYVAGRLLNYDIRKTAWGGMHPPRLYDHVVKMVEKGFYAKELLEYYDEASWNKMNEFIDHDRDLRMSHIGVNEYMTKYAVRDRSLSEVVPLETPQITYMLIAALMCLDTKNLKDVRNYYNDISNHNISLPTPIMAGLRTRVKQFSSCTLIETADDLRSIAATSSAIMLYVANKAGIGIGAHYLRAEGDSVRGGEIKHTGVIPFYRLFESSVKSCSQGGVRGGAATLYTAIWHLEIEEILNLKNNKGTPDTRVRKIDYGIQINDYLYDRLVKGKDITLFSPSEHSTPGLMEAFFSDKAKFIELYEKYEADPTVRKKTIPAIELFTKLMIERKDTGRIYVFNVDNANDHSPFQEPVRMSNLCAEIVLPTKPLYHVDDEKGRIALCTLKAMNLGNLKSLDDFEGWMRNAVRGLDNLLDYQEYPVPAAHQATLDYRPLGIGVINLAYYLAKNGVKYGDEACLKLIHETFEAMQYYGIKASIELAKERGPCRNFEQTKWAKGLLPIDHYNKNVDLLVKPEYRYDWDGLRADLLKYGIRNATITALMPAESSAKVSNSTNGVEPVRALVTVKGNKSNVSKQVVPEITKLKNKYDMLWDMTSMAGYIKTMAVIQKFVCNSISSNLSYNPAHYPDGMIPMSVLLKDLLLCNKYGLKTLYYHNTNDNRDELLLVDDKPEAVSTENEVQVEEETCSSCVI